MRWSSCARLDHCTARSAPLGTAFFRRKLCSDASQSYRHTRNVGIIAHIDAGKTTTTERMLLLAGVTRAAGSVDDGDTVTDHLDQERERGITIQAAAVSFDWRAHHINLIDTPGHVDFTIEVERSTRVLDGAALIVDAVAGAQAQTETVWRQARAHGIPAVAMVNKMDREGADFDAAVASLEARLGLTALPVQLPLPAAAGGATGGGAGVGGAAGGAVDLIDLCVLSYWPSDDDAAGTGGRARRGAPLRLERRSLPSESAGAATADEREGAAQLGSLSLDDVYAARASLVERVAELDPEGSVATSYLEEENVSGVELREAIRGLTLSGVAVPTLCGAALRGVGVEPLLDAITAYLPSPADRPTPTLSPPAANTHADASGTGGTGGAGGTGGGASGAPVELAHAASAVALAFKVVHDARTKKPVVWLRVYNGVFAPSDTCVNARSGVGERLQRLHALRGDEATEVLHAPAGSIVAATGLKSTRTGDTLLLQPQPGCHELTLPALTPPNPVFFSAIETASASQQGQLDAALAAICLEDPSVVVRNDPVSGQHDSHSARTATTRSVPRAR
jgi:elongation factor G